MLVGCSAWAAVGVPDDVLSAAGLLPFLRLKMPLIVFFTSSAASGAVYHRTKGTISGTVAGRLGGLASRGIRRLTNARHY